MFGFRAIASPVLKCTRKGHGFVEQLLEDGPRAAVYGLVAVSRVGLKPRGASGIRHVGSDHSTVPDARSTRHPPTSASRHARRRQASSIIVESVPNWVRWASGGDFRCQTRARHWLSGGNCCE
jgi:hypothetical protein